jgi:acetyl-CoA carboxylase biotin carboxyl carrier protein
MDTISNDDLKWLLQLLESGQLAEIEVAIGEDRVLLKAAGVAAVAAGMAPVAASGVTVPGPVPAAPREPALPEGTETLRAPMAGIFYRKPSPEKDPYSEPGDEVQVGDTIGLIEAMKLYNEVTSHIHGRVLRFLAENEQPVEADAPLVHIEPFHSPV